jgi:beta-glucanase (GH16 family)
VFIGSKTNPSDTGYLVIEARKENYGIAPENRQFTSGRINTSGKFNFKYGTIEAKIKLPDLQNGLWPAFWMLGANYPEVGWPRSGEIDILEAGFKDDWQNNVANKKTNTTVHWFQDNFQELDPNAPGNGWWGNASATGSTTITGTFNEDYHIFKLTWTPTKIEGYVDGSKFYDFVIPANQYFTEFNDPYFLILNLAVGGSNFVGITNPAQITAPMPAQMLVDYVRVFSSEAAIRGIASTFAYDHGEADEPTLRGGAEEVAEALQAELQTRLAKAGVVVEEARLTHLAYAPEIASVMLRRQQAEAIVAARALIVQGAVDMVRTALEELDKQQIVQLDPERRAAMVSNLLVVLCGNSDASPVINTGTLYA